MPNFATYTPAELRRMGYRDAGNGQWARVGSGTERALSTPVAPNTHLTEKREMLIADRAASRLGFLTIKFSQPRASKQTRGIPDRKYYHVGRAMSFWWEAKSEKGKVSPAQGRFHEMCRACGEAVVVGTSEVAVMVMRTIAERR